MIDLHTHLLPGLDDGPATLDDAVALACDAVAAGVSEVVVTPHVSARYPNGWKAVSAALGALRSGLADAEVPLRLHAGAEVAMEQALGLPPEELRRLTLGEGPFVLLESPLGAAPVDAELVVERIHAGGLRVVLAHPERCRVFQRDRGQLDRLVALGVLTAVTATAFQGAFGRAAQHAAEDMLGAGLAHVLVSDMHDRVHRRPGIPVPACAGDEDAGAHAARFAWMTEEVPAAILAGATIPPGPVVPPRPVGRVRSMARVRRLVRSRLR